MEKEREIPRVEDLALVLLGEGTPIERWVWRIKGTDTWHHPTQPAVQYTNGDWIWFWMDREHRWDGPSAFWRGGIQYWIHGTELTKEEWERDPRRLEWLRTQAERI